MKKDPLHVPSAELVVWHKGKEHLVLNKRLLDSQNCWANLELIKSLHVKRLVIEDLMAEGKQDIAELNKKWTENQFELQKAWGFTEDSKFHRFWDIPACKCAKLDNNDAYPTGYYSISGGCPIHGYSVGSSDVEEV